MRLIRSSKLAGGWIRHWWMALSLAVLLGGGGTFAGAGSPPLVEFDVPFSIGCRSIPLRESDKSPASTPLKQFLDNLSGPSRGPAGVDPDRELIEVVVPVSARVQAGTEKDLKQCLYTFVDPAAPEVLQVTDWLPRTELKTEYAKPIQFNKEHQASIGINVAAKYVVSATSQAGGQLKSGVNYEMLPPQEIVLASGTTQHGHGLFYKLKPSTQTTIEGVKSFSAIFSVPRGWRGGCLKLECEAIGVDRGVVPLFDREVNNTPAVFFLALYRAGDAEAERLAAHMAKSQQEMFDSLAVQRREMRAAWYKVFSRSGPVKWHGFLDKPNLFGEPLPPTTEATLLGRVLDRSATPADELEDYPSQIRERLRALQAAAAALQALSVGRPLVQEHAATAPVRSMPAVIPSTDLLPASAHTSRR